MSRDPMRSHGVLVLLLDAPEDVIAARFAAERAARAGTRVLAAVLLPPVGPTLDGEVVAAATALRRQDAEAVAARVQPAVSTYDVPLTAVPLLLAPGRSRWTHRRLRRTLRLLVARSGAHLVVVPPRRVLGLAPEAVAALVPGAVVAPSAGQPQHSPGAPV